MSKKIISIDLPWSENNFTAVTYFEISDDTGRILDFHCFSKKLNRKENYIFHLQGCMPFDISNSIDIIMLDMPIGGLSYKRCLHPKYRPVELAFTNSAFIANTKIQYPRFQGGIKFANSGFELGLELLDLFGTSSCSVIECFPQITIPSLMQNNFYQNFEISKLSTHKANRSNAKCMWNILRNILKQHSLDSIQFNYLTEAGLADLCDSVLGALPALDFLSDGKFLSKDIVWLLNNPGDVDHPYITTKTALKKELRKTWIKSVEKSDLIPGVLDKGILTYRV